MWPIRIDRTAAVPGARVRTPGVDRFVQLADVRKLAAKAASAAISLAHRFLPVFGSAKARPSSCISSSQILPRIRTSHAHRIGKRMIDDAHCGVLTNFAPLTASAIKGKRTGRSYPARVIRRTPRENAKIVMLHFVQPAGSALQSLRSLTAEPAALSPH